MLKDRSVLKKAFIELYAGCGGSVLGTINAGLKCLAAVEWYPAACWSMWTNLCMAGFSNFKVQEDLLPAMQKMIGNRFETHNKLFTHIPGDDWLTQTDEISPVLNVYCADMLQLDPYQLMRDVGIEPGELGLVIGGPPCQGFSYAGQRKENDHRNQHPFRFMEFVKAIQPCVFKMENVPGLLTLGRAKNETEGPFPKWIREAGNAAGYHVTYQVLNAMHYGVPQTRRRVFFTGIRNDLYEQGMRYQFPEPTHTWSYHDAVEAGTLEAHLQTGKEPYVTVFEAIGDLGRWWLSSRRSADCKHLPEGHPERRSSDAADSEVRDDNHIWYKDRFTGNYFKGNHMGDLNGMFDDERMQHYRSCIVCQKLNVIARTACHYCHYLLLPNIRECL